MINTLSGRFLVLTIVFVMLAEVLILIPSIARFRLEYLSARVERAQIASLALLADDMLSEALERELLQNADVFNVVLRRDATRELVLTSKLPQPVHKTFDLRSKNTRQVIKHALGRLIDPEPRVIRVIGQPRLEGGSSIEVTLYTEKLRTEMIDYGIRILLLSAVISVFTASLLFYAVRILMVKPINRVIDHMRSYAISPEDARQIITPGAKVKELRQAEAALQSMQEQLLGVLRQKRRLAQLGEAVSKLSHDLRNILGTVQLLSDRMESSQDPFVGRLAPKLINSVTRAIKLTESTLSFSKAEQPAPQLQKVELFAVAAEVIENEKMLTQDPKIIFASSVPKDMVVNLDPDQIYRVLTNLVRNARQAIEIAGTGGLISIEAKEDERSWFIHVTDTGQGLPENAKTHLFEPFKGAGGKGGTGLGLSISQELTRSHGGKIELLHSDHHGTKFQVKLPKSTC